MSQEENSDGVDGSSIEDATDAVVARDDAPARETVRETLATVAEDGVVTWNALDDELAHVSKVVSTPETRIELASAALSDARESAAPVSDLDVVQTRLSTLDARETAISDEIDVLADDLQDLVERASDREDLYAVAASLRRLIERANGAHRAADELDADVEDFERWLSNPEARVRGLDPDVDMLAESLDGLSAGLDDLADADSEAEADIAWVEAAFRHRVLGLFLEDVGAELTDLRTWARRENLDETGDLDAVEDRLDELEARHDTMGDRLDDLARPAWEAAHEERLATFESALADFDPPVDWSEVLSVLDEHRSVLRQDA